MPEFANGLAPIHFPLIGNSIVIGIFSLLHIALAGIAVGFMVLAPLLEALAPAGSDSFYPEAARTLTRFTVVTFTTSMVFAVIMIELIIGLFPVTNSVMFNRFRFPIGLGVAAFFLQLFTLYPYYHYWEPIRKWSRRVHILLGALAALFIVIWGAVLDGMGSYMLTPVAFGSPLFNSTWIPLVVHRFFGNFVPGGFALAAYGAWRLGRQKDEAEAPYYLFLMKIGLVVGVGALLIQPVTGFFYATQIGRAAPEAYAAILQGKYRFWVYLQFILIALLFIGSLLLLRSAGPEKKGGLLLIGGAIPIAALMITLARFPAPRRLFTFLLAAMILLYFYRGREAFLGAPQERLGRAGARRLAISLGIAALFLYWTMGTIREIARRPDTIRGVISLQDESRSASHLAGAR